MYSDKIIDFTKRLHEKELEKIPQSTSKQQFLEELMEFIASHDSQEDDLEAQYEEDFFEFLLLIKTELYHLKEKGVVADYKIEASTKEKSITLRVMPSISVDKINMNVIVSNGEYD